MNRDFRVWAVVMLKGGARKTTTTALTAFALADGGAEVLVVDADTHTQGLTEWLSLASADGRALPVSFMQWSRSAGQPIAPFIRHAQRATGAQWVIVDLGAEDPHAIRQVCAIADMIISPCGPEQAELSRLPATRALVAPLHPLVLLTRVDQPGRGAAADMRAVLEADGCAVLRTEVPRDRARYAHVYGSVPDDCGAYAAVAGELLARDAELQVLAGVR
jgi:chromosome partitioning protein